jgi:hypothetical protein
MELKTARKTEDELFYEKVLSVSCPYCLAPKGAACTDPRGEKVRPNGSMVVTHRRRIEWMTAKEAK